MSSQKSYLAPHPSWFNAADSPLCPMYGDEPATFSSAILRCPAKASAQARHLQDVSLHSYLVLNFSPSLTGRLHKGHWYHLPTGHPFLSSSLLHFAGFSFIPRWLYSCGPACFFSTLPPFGFLLRWMMGWFPFTFRKLV